MEGHSDRPNDRTNEPMGRYMGGNIISCGNSITLLKILERIYAITTRSFCFFLFLNYDFRARDVL